MKASELSESLKKLIAEHGDLEVYVPSNEGGGVEATGIVLSTAPLDTAGAPSGWKHFVLTE